MMCLIHAFSVVSLLIFIALQGSDARTGEQCVGYTLDYRGTALEPPLGEGICEPKTPKHIEDCKRILGTDYADLRGTRCDGCNQTTEFCCYSKGYWQHPPPPPCPNPEPADYHNPYVSPPYVWPACGRMPHSAGFGQQEIPFNMSSESCFMATIYENSPGDWRQGLGVIITDRFILALKSAIHFELYKLPHGVLLASVGPDRRAKAVRVARIHFQNATNNNLNRNEAEEFVLIELQEPLNMSAVCPVCLPDPATQTPLSDYLDGFEPYQGSCYGYGLWYCEHDSSKTWDYAITKSDYYYYYNRYPSRPFQPLIHDNNPQCLQYRENSTSTFCAQIHNALGDYSSYCMGPVNGVPMVCQDETSPARLVGFQLSGSLNCSKEDGPRFICVLGGEWVGFGDDATLDRRLWKNSIQFADINNQQTLDWIQKVTTSAPPPRPANLKRVPQQCSRMPNSSDPTDLRSEFCFMARVNTETNPKSSYGTGIIVGDRFILTLKNTFYNLYGRPLEEWIVNVGSEPDSGINNHHKVAALHFERDNNLNFNRDQSEELLLIQLWRKLNLKKDACKACLPDVAKQVPISRYLDGNNRYNGICYGFGSGFMDSVYYFALQRTLPWGGIYDGHFKSKGFLPRPNRECSNHDNRNSSSTYCASMYELSKSSDQYHIKSCMRPTIGAAMFCKEMDEYGQIETSPVRLMGFQTAGAEDCTEEDQQTWKELYPFTDINNKAAIHWVQQIISSH